MDSWEVLRLGDRSCLVKYTFDDTSYEILVTDYERIYGERIDAKNLEIRSKALNPRLSGSPSDFLAHIARKLKERETDSTISTDLVQKSEDEIHLIMKTQLRELPFQWEFHCHQEPNKELGSQMVIPLVVMVGELLRRQDELQKIISKKDREINDYKMSGSQVSRKTLETVPFVPGSFTKTMNDSPMFDGQVRGFLRVFEQYGCQELYKQVMKKRAQIIEQLQEDPSWEPLQGQSSFPTSSFITPTRPKSATPLTSPQMGLGPVPMPDLPPPPSSAEAEKKARERIKKRLEEEAAKEKSKKKRKKVI
ncbi:non-homologous end-joining factor 1-like [Oscarella lobularis]|uniref:non-homologous end-joining factor 1-like n=1 Tax=Oscarella lobularis TaxID=121494 RepID=UPI0033136D54